MANGATTIQIQNAIQALLQGRNPSPLAPVPLAPAQPLGPLSLETTAALGALQPQPVPPALPPPIDVDAIRARFAALVGPEPVPPAAQPVSLLQKIALALQGFGAGVQGQGPQFLAGLREQRERPQREFEARRERFESRRAELGLLAEQEVSRAETRAEEKRRELLDKQFDREFEQGVRRLNLRDQREQDLFRDALLAKRQREENERQAQENRRKEEAQNKRDAGLIAREASKLGATPEIAKEIGDFFAGRRDKLSPAAAKFESAQARLAQIRADRLTAGGGAAKPQAPQVFAEIEDRQGGVTTVPFNSQVQQAASAGQFRVRRVFSPQIPGQPQASPQAIPTGFPEFSGTLQVPQAQPAPGGQIFTRAQVEAFARKTKRNPKEVEAALRARGFDVR